MSAIATAAAMVLLLTPAPARAQVELPMRVDAWLSVPVVSSPGDTLRFVIDTGATRSVISTSTGVDHAVGPAVDVLVQGASGTLVAKQVTLPRMTLGDLTLRDLPVVVLPDSVLGRGGELFAGILGVDVLGRFDVLIDAPNGRLGLYPPGSSGPALGEALGEAVPITLLGGGIIRHEARVNGAVLEALLDTGAQYSVINSVGAAHAAVRSAEPAVTRSPGLGSGTVSVRPVRLDRLSLGSADLVDVAARLSDMSIFRDLGLQRLPAVLIGAPSLRRCAVLIAYGDRTIRYCRVAD